jgi:hypothetical protein
MQTAGHAALIVFSKVTLACDLGTHHELLGRCAVYRQLYQVTTKTAA